MWKPLRLRPWSLSRRVDGLGVSVLGRGRYLPPLICGSRKLMCHAWLFCRWPLHWWSQRKRLGFHARMHVPPMMRFGLLFMGLTLHLYHCLSAPHRRHWVPLRTTLPMVEFES